MMRHGLGRVPSNHWWGGILTNRQRGATSNQRQKVIIVRETLPNVVPLLITPGTFRPLPLL